MANTTPDEHLQKELLALKAQNKQLKRLLKEQEQARACRQEMGERLSQRRANNI